MQGAAPEAAEVAGEQLDFTHRRTVATLLVTGSTELAPELLALERVGERLFKHASGRRRSPAMRSALGQKRVSDQSGAAAASLGR